MRHIPLTHRYLKNKVLEMESKLKSLEMAKLKNNLVFFGLEELRLKLYQVEFMERNWHGEGFLENSKCQRAKSTPVGGTSGAPK